nr:N-acetylmuramoyl-L-alanine amidase [Corynebacterium lactis]
MKHRTGLRILPATVALIASMSSVAAGLSACTIDKDNFADPPRTSQVATTMPENTAASASATPTDARRAAPNPTSPTAATDARQDGTNGDHGALAGRTIYLDPGHAGTPPPQSLQVTDGRGGTKTCNTAGTSSDAGFPEHEFNWMMAQEIQQLLTQRGATVLLSRGDDTGRADCIDARAEKENSSDADAVVSLHADGAGQGNRGFHVSAIADPLPHNDAAGSTALAESLRDALAAAGFVPSNYLGSEGLNPRADLTGLNLSTRPKALIEYGNMRDSADIVLLSSPDGRRRLAEATVAGIEAFLAR